MTPLYSNGTTPPERPCRIPISYLLTDPMPATPTFLHRSHIDQLGFAFQHTPCSSPDGIVSSGPSGYPSPTVSHCRAELPEYKPSISDSFSGSAPYMYGKPLVEPHNAAKPSRTSRTNNGGGVQKSRKANPGGERSKADPKHSLTQGKLRFAQGYQLKVLERLLGSMGWKGRRLNSENNGHSSGLVHNKFDIQECVIRRVSFLNYIVRFMFKPETIAQLSSLDLWEPESCSEDNDVSRSQVNQPLGLHYNSAQHEHERRDIILDMMPPDLRPLVERHFAEHVHFPY